MKSNDNINEMRTMVIASQSYANDHANHPYQHH